MFVLPTSGAPMASHVPFLVNEQPDGKIQIALHVARANRLHTLIGTGCQAFLVCQGPDAYISPDWLCVPNQVPTRAYVSAHVTGTATVLPDAESLAHVGQLSEYFEQRLHPKEPWTLSAADMDRLDALLQAIVSIVVDVEKVEAQKEADPAQRRNGTPWRDRRIALTR